MAKLPFTVRLPGISHQQINDLAASRGLNKTEAFSMAIEQMAQEVFRQGVVAMGEKLHPLNARLSEDILQKLKALGDSTGMTETQVAVMAIDRLARASQGEK